MNTTKAGKNADVAEIEATESTQDFAAELAALRKEFQALVDQAGTAGKAATGAASTALRAQAAKSVEVGEHYPADAMEEWRAIDRKVVAATQESPWRTLGIAALGGLVLGLILRR